MFMPDSAALCHYFREISGLGQVVGERQEVTTPNLKIVYACMSILWHIGRREMTAWLNRTLDHKGEMDWGIAARPLRL